MKRSTRRPYGFILWLICMTILAGTALGQTSVPVAKTIEDRIAQLEKEIELLKQQQKTAQEVRVKRDIEGPAVFAGKDGFALKSSDSGFQLKFKSVLQTDARLFVNDTTPAGTDTFLIRKMRPILEGTVFDYFDFKLMPDFGNGQALLYDAFVDYRYWSWASVKVGKYKPPIGLERLQADVNNMFTELALTQNLVPNRDVGVELHGDLFSGRLNYSLGVFNGTADGTNMDIDVHDSKDFAARLFALPFKHIKKDWLNGLGVGIGSSIGTSHGSSSNPNLPNYKSDGQQTIFRYRNDGTADGTAITDGLRTHIAPQFYYYFGPLGVLGEYVISSQNVKRGMSSKASLQNTAGQIAVSYLLTGEKASYYGVVPKNNFDPGRKKWGALEVVSRFNWLDNSADNFPLFADSNNSVRSATAWGFGFNWYLNRCLKLVADFETTAFTSGNFNGQDRKPENVFISRVQLAF